MQPTSPADPFDRATEIEIRERDSAVAAARDQCARDDAARLLRAGPGLCQNCQALILFGLYCDMDCRDDYELRAKARARNGSPPTLKA